MNSPEKSTVKFLNIFMRKQTNITGKTLVCVLLTLRDKHFMGTNHPHSLFSVTQMTHFQDSEK